MTTITIHRANQIGGCITVIEHDGCKVIIDLGGNLPESGQQELSKTDINRLTAGVNAIFYTHYHGDHVGLHHLVDKEIPQFIGKGAKDVMMCKYNVLGRHSDMTEQIESAQRMRTFLAERPVTFPGCDKIKVTPYFVSHSAFDAYMFMVECAGVRILHTGDFRRHGYLGKGLFPMLSRYVGNVDVLITEGTMLGRKREVVLKEADIRDNVVKALRSHKYVYALCSSTDIDRLASFHDACKTTGREMFVDGYQQEVLSKFTEYAGKKSPLFFFDRTFRLINYKTENVVRHLKHTGFLMPIRSGMEYLVRGMMETYHDEEPWLIYSMWGGYALEGEPFTNDKIVNIRHLFGDRIYDGTKDGFHTSGHADTDTLADVCTCTSPRLGVIPIHKDSFSLYDMDKVKPYHIITSSERISDLLNIIVE